MMASFFILNAKKTETRGADRIIQLNRAEAWRLKWAINDFHVDLQKNIANRLPRHYEKRVGQNQSIHMTSKKAEHLLYL